MSFILSVNSASVAQETTEDCHNQKNLEQCHLLEIILVLFLRGGEGVFCRGRIYGD